MRKACRKVGVLGFKEKLESQTYRELPMLGERGNKGNMGTGPSSAAKLPLACWPTYFKLEFLKGRVPSVLEVI
jgi:hypothetical protein